MKAQKIAVGEGCAQEYCFWDIQLPQSSQIVPLNPLMAYWNSLAMFNNGQGLNFQNFSQETASPLNDVSKVLNLLNNGLQSWGSELQTESSVQQNLEKPVYSTPDMGESEKKSEKDAYIKAVFHITKVDRQTKKEKRINKHRHVISLWEHVGAQYYARGMCKKCYFSKGKRKKNATKCPHKERSHYAIGMCKLWYLKNYHKTHDRKKE